MFTKSSLESKHWSAVAAFAFVLAVCWMAAPAGAVDVEQSADRLSAARQGLVGSSVGELAFFAGGSSRVGGLEQFSEAVDVYNSRTGEWFTDSLSWGRDNLTAASVAGRVVFFGGFGANRWEPFTDVLELETGQWRIFTVPGAEMSAAASNESVAFFAGGYDGYAYRRTVDVYDAAADAWVMLPNALSQGRYALAATAVNGKVLFAGGRWGTNTSSRVDIYDTATGEWSIAELSQARGHLAAVTVGNQALFAGGYGSREKNPQTTVDIYDGETGEWSVAQLSAPRGKLAAAAIGNLAFFAGGDYSDVVDIYDGETGEWSTAQLSQGRSSLTATAAGNRVIFAGGVTPGEVASDAVDIFTVSACPPGLQLMVLEGVPAPLGEPAPVGAALTDADGNPVAGMSVRFRVVDEQGELAGETAAVTDDEGLAISAVEGLAAGVYQVVADSDDAACPIEPDGGMLIVLDPQAPRTTGGGFIITGQANGRGHGSTPKANFGFNAGIDAMLNAVGNLEFHDKAGGIKLHSDSLIWYTAGEGVATFEGVGTNDGEGEFTFRVHATDGRPTDGDDGFAITVWEGGDTAAEPMYEAGGALGGGSIVIHDRQPASNRARFRELLSQQENRKLPENTELRRSSREE